MARTLTAANAIITIAVAGLFPAAFQLQGFAADDIFDTDPLDSAETSMGVDGVFSAGFVFVPVRQGFTLQANSPSIDPFEIWWGASQVALDVYPATGEVVLTAVNKAYTLSNGYLTSFQPIPNAGRILRPRKFGITWGKVFPMPI